MARAAGRPWHRRHERLPKPPHHSEHPVALQPASPQAVVVAAANSAACADKLGSLSNSGIRDDSITALGAAADARQRAEQPAASSTQAGRGWKRKRRREENWLPDDLPAKSRTKPSAPASPGAASAADPLPGVAGPSAAAGHAGHRAMGPAAPGTRGDMSGALHHAFTSLC